MQAGEEWALCMMTVLKLCGGQGEGFEEMKGVWLGSDQKIYYNAGLVQDLNNVLRSTACIPT